MSTFDFWDTVVVLHTDPATGDITATFGLGTLSGTPWPVVGIEPDPILYPWISDNASDASLVFPAPLAGRVPGSGDIANVSWAGTLTGELTAGTVNLTNASGMALPVFENDLTTGGGPLRFEGATITANFASLTGSIAFEQSDLTIQQSGLTLGASGTGVYDFVGSSLDVAEGLAVASGGTWELNLEDGSNATVGSLVIGPNSTAIGHVTVDRSTVTSGELIIGFRGAGHLTVENGADVKLSGSDGSFLVGWDLGGEGHVKVTGESGVSGKSTLDISNGGTIIGGGGIGVVTVADDALLRTQNATLGYSLGAVGTVNLDHAGWVAADIVIANGGDGILNIRNDAALESQNIRIGNLDRSLGEATLDHSIWRVHGSMGIGFEGGEGTLRVINGGELSFTKEGNEALTIGWADGDGLVVVSGPGSQLSVNQVGNFINLGATGDGELQVSNSGTVVTPGLLVGSEGGAPSVAVVDVDSSGLIRVGEKIHLRSGLLDVNDGGSIVVGNASQISKTIHIGSDGEIIGTGLIQGNLVNEGGINANLSFGSEANLVINNGSLTGQLLLGSGDDTFKGTAGRAAKVFGESGHDELIGGSFGDTFNGGAGRDTLTGRAGKDTLSGGLGPDVFDFDSIKDSVKGSKRDQIMDFSHQDDIDLRTIDAQSGGGNQKFSWIGKDGFHDEKGELRYVDKGSTVIVQGDTNGDGKADFEIFVKIGALGKGDFLL